jgi:peptidoglycan/LPS O-acetylase OafA/YrhL
MIHHVLFLGNYDSSTYNPVIWSLIQELRISIIFPLLMMLIIRFNWKANILIAGLCSIFSYGLTYASWHYTLSSMTKDMLGLFNTLEWIPMFVFGALIGKHISNLQKLYMSLSRTIKLCLLVAGVSCYTYTHWFPIKNEIIRLSILSDWIVSAGAMIFIFFAINSRILSSVLLLRPLNFIGKISYSVYLYHLIILIAFMQLFYGSIPVVIIWLFTIILTLCLSTISYYFVESPFMRMGKKLALQLPKRYPEEDKVTT